jgi:hypothetical protein
MKNIVGFKIIYIKILNIFISGGNVLILAQFYGEVKYIFLKLCNCNPQYSIQTIPRENTKFLTLCLFL